MSTSIVVTNLGPRRRFRITGVHVWSTHNEAGIGSIGFSVLAGQYSTGFGLRLPDINETHIMMFRSRIKQMFSKHTATLICRRSYLTEDWLKHLLIGAYITGTPTEEFNSENQTRRMTILP